MIKSTSLPDVFVWAEEQINTKNSNCLFILEANAKSDGYVRICVSAHSFYKLYINGKLKSYGPARSAKGTFRVDERSFYLKKGVNKITVVASAYNVATYSIVKDTPFFFFSAKINGKEYSSADFVCYDFSIRCKNVQRYSFQRGFVEFYRQDCDFAEWTQLQKKEGKRLRLINLTPQKHMKRVVPYPIIKNITVTKPVQSGFVAYNGKNPLWKDRSIFQVGNNFEGYKKEKLEECLSDTVCGFTFLKGEINAVLSEMTYSVYDFGRNLTGFVRLCAEVKEECELYFIFDEITGGEETTVDFVRLSCSSVIKWELKTGCYNLESFEPYTMRYAQIILKSGCAKIKSVGIVPVENKEAYNLEFSVADKKINAVLCAARNTAAQNMTDLIMDCPSRERAGWINDMFFSRKSARLFTGNIKVQKTSLQNYLFCGQLSTLPKNMVPMCYPSDHLNGEYIPNNAMWYVINLCEYFDYSYDKISKVKAQSQILKIIDFFNKYENSDGLLEDLDGWIFIEWSMANDKSFVCGVNYPTNMLYYKMLCNASKLFNDNTLLEKSKKIKKTIIKQSYNGNFFEDNRIRENNELILKGHISEACQYYAFFSGVADSKNFPALYNNLLNNFGPLRDTAKLYSNIDKANIITGLLMRQDILIENDELNKSVNEITEIFYIMANKTMTLWENVNSNASCNHGIASYAGCLLMEILTGYAGFKNNNQIFKPNYLGIDCYCLIPYKNKWIEVEIIKGKRKIKFLISKKYKKFNSLINENNKI